LAIYSSKIQFLFYFTIKNYKRLKKTVQQRTNHFLLQSIRTWKAKQEKYLKVALQFLVRLLWSLFNTIFKELDFLNDDFSHSWLSFLKLVLTFATGTLVLRNVQVTLVLRNVQETLVLPFATVTLVLRYVTVTLVLPFVGNVRWENNETSFRQCVAGRRRFQVGNRTLMRIRILNRNRNRISVPETKVRRLALIRRREIRLSVVVGYQINL
jgi:hypothetical protein